MDSIWRLLFAMCIFAVGFRADTVSYDHRALIINGQRRMLISGSIHYPRATPQMWPGLISAAKSGGVDVIETYVFWDGHEPSKGQYYFEDRYDLVAFLKLIQQAGLYANLRIGPYVCAEWNLGGFPAWLRDIPGIQFRTNNEPFKEEMQRFVEKIVSMMKSEKLFAPQGGPIILAQIENEYGNIDAAFGEDGKKYMLWAANMAQSLETGVPWIMCQQKDAPDYIINTCNGYYCDGFVPNTDKKPTFWTENWSGWFRAWGGPSPHRPAEDVAFAVARFFQRGGSLQNYYMYFGGTNFGRTSGGPYITTSYDYDAPIDEYGQVRQPKWGHLKDLHSAIKQCEPALVSGDPKSISLGSSQEAHVYGAIGSNVCAAFLANIDTVSSATVTFNGQSYVLPAWSVSILPDCKNVIFNTAMISTQTTNMVVKPVAAALGTSGLPWVSFKEPIGIWGDSPLKAVGLREQISTTKDSTDYLWYTTSVQVSTDVKATLVLKSMRDVVQIFVNGKYAGSSTTNQNTLYRTVQQKIQLASGINTIALLCSTIGLQNYGAKLEQWGAGINGSISLQGLMDLTNQEWIYQVGLQGEQLKLYTSTGAGLVSWSSSAPVNQQLTWYKTEFDAPSGINPVLLDLGSMGKGIAWVNGQSIGRYWASYYVSRSGCSATCDYRGAYTSSKCTTGCGQQSQRWYHIPRSWLKDTGNLLVLFEESGGNPSGVSTATRRVAVVCSQMSEDHPVENPEMELKCDVGHEISTVNFASYGNPSGSCGSFSKGSCHFTNSHATVEKACVGHQNCSIHLSWKHTQNDPCPTLSKSLAVELQCTPSK